MNGAFEAAVAFVLEHEGGLVDDPLDPGGVTKFGISQRSYPDMAIRSLTREAATAIYRRDFWDRLRCDALPRTLGIALFDTAVNLGPRAATQLLQESVDVTPDGVIGPVTLRAVARAVESVRVLDVLTELLARRARYYLRLPTVDRYGLGWLQRCFRLYRLCLKS